MNFLIEKIFENFAVNGELIPVRFLDYKGHGEPYVTYMQTNSDYILRADDALQMHVDYYDFDVYAKVDYLSVIRGVKATLEQNGFVWRPERSGPDMFETDTEYYHKTLSFSYLIWDSE